MLSRKVASVLLICSPKSPRNIIAERSAIYKRFYDVTSEHNATIKMQCIAGSLRSVYTHGRAELWTNGCKFLISNRGMASPKKINTVADLGRGGGVKGLQPPQKVSGPSIAESR